MSDAAIEVVDALGRCELRRRPADLDGSVPLRAARACVPLLEGNAFGWSIAARSEVALRRRWSTWRIDDEAIVRAARAAVPYLTAHGLLDDGPWTRRLADGPLFEDSGRLGWWTGLLIRTSAPMTLWLGDAGARRNRDVAIGEINLVVGERWMPLVLELEPSRGLDQLELGGEIASLAAVDPRPNWRFVELSDAPEVGAAHLRFYDAAYFDDKREGATKKYRRLLAEPADNPGATAAVVVRVGPCTVTVEPCEREHSAAGPRSGSGLSRLVFRNAIAFRARHDGRRVHIDADRDQLAANAAEIEATWRTAFPAETLARHRGALLYLAKYFTPHVDGEPHFFVKPTALLATPPGIATLVDGIGGAGYDVQRGVVRTDRFGAVPAVFAMWGSGATIDVPLGRPLARMLTFTHGRDAPALRRLDSLPTAARSP